MNRRKIRLIESNAKCRHLKEFTCNGTFWQVFICLRTTPFVGFYLGWSQCCTVGSESGQIESVKLLLNMVSNTTQQPPPPPSTHCLYIMYFDTGKVGEVNQREGSRGNSSESWVENANMTWLIVSQVVNSNKHLSQNPVTGNFNFGGRHFALLSIRLIVLRFINTELLRGRKFRRTNSKTHKLKTQKRITQSLLKTLIFLLFLMKMLRHLKNLFWCLYS